MVVVSLAVFAAATGKPSAVANFCVSGSPQPTVFNPFDMQVDAACYTGIPNPTGFSYQDSIVGNVNASAQSFNFCFLQAFVPGFNFTAWHQLTVSCDTSSTSFIHRNSFGDTQSVQQNVLMGILIDGAFYCATQFVMAATPFTPSQSPSAGLAVLDERHLA
jgi:hypothetical protein